MANQKYKFERLTPIDNMDLDVYEEAIDYVFSNSDVKNVAISGAYSAGKSSVLASYKKKHGELRFLHISLAHFKSTDQKSNAEVKESTLEGKILNQLIHQIPSEKIPQTNFRVKKTVSSKSIVTSTICAVLFLISIIHLLFFSVWKNYVSFLPVSLIKSILMPSTHPYALIVDGIIIYNTRRSQAKFSNLLMIITTAAGMSPEISEDNTELAMYCTSILGKEDFELIKHIIIENKTMIEASNEIGISVEACKKRVQRAKKKLRKSISEDFL